MHISAEGEIDQWRDYLGWDKINHAGTRLSQSEEISCIGKKINWEGCEIDLSSSLEELATGLHNCDKVTIVKDTRSSNSKKSFLTLRESRRTAFSETNRQVLTEVKEITDSLIMIFNSPQNVYSII